MRSCNCFSVRNSKDDDDRGTDGGAEGLCWPKSLRGRRVSKREGGENELAEKVSWTGSGEELDKKRLKRCSTRETSISRLSRSRKCELLHLPLLPRCRTTYKQVAVNVLAVRRYLRQGPERKRPRPPTTPLRVHRKSRGRIRSGLTSAATNNRLALGSWSVSPPPGPPHVRVNYKSPKKVRLLNTAASRREVK